jgi:hypothetical protein
VTVLAARERLRAHREQDVVVVAFRLEGFELLEIENVREILDRHVEDPRERAELVERRECLALFESAELGIVDRFAEGIGLLLDLAQRVAVTLAQAPQMLSEPGRRTSLHRSKSRLRGTLSRWTSRKPRASRRFVAHLSPRIRAALANLLTCFSCIPTLWICQRRNRAAGHFAGDQSALDRPHLSPYIHEPAATIGVAAVAGRRCR